MATTEVLLIQQVENLGAEGDRVKVKAGYARNWLLPRHLAVPLTQANKKHLESLMKAREKREANELQQAEEVGAKLSAVSVAISVKTGEGGKMFGSVTVPQLLEKLAEQGFHLERRHIVPFSPVKELGKHSATCKLHPEVQIDVAFEVVSENPIEQ
ncbi:MAG: 50S ribosomal protein L9 [Opitutales bacterium]